MIGTILWKKRLSKGRRIRFLPFFFIVLLLAVGVYTLSTLRRVLPSLLPSNEDHTSIRVEVLNGCGVPRLAREVSWELRRLGFDVVFVGDAHEKDLADALKKFDISPSLFWILNFGEARELHLPSAEEGHALEFSSFSKK